MSSRRTCVLFRNTCVRELAPAGQAADTTIRSKALLAEAEVRVSSTVHGGMTSQPHASHLSRVSALLSKRVDLIGEQRASVVLHLYSIGPPLTHSTTCLSQEVWVPRLPMRWVHLLAVPAPRKHHSASFEEARALPLYFSAGVDTPVSHTLGSALVYYGVREPRASGVDTTDGLAATKLARARPSVPLLSPSLAHTRTFTPSGRFSHSHFRLVLLSFSFRPALPAPARRLRPGARLVEYARRQLDARACSSLAARSHACTC
eukprot:4978742-Pleurochrysis_carterae.AAC.2